MRFIKLASLIMQTIANKSFFNYLFLYRYTYKNHKHQYKYKKINIDKLTNDLR